MCMAVKPVKLLEYFYIYSVLHGLSQTDHVYICIRMFRFLGVTPVSGERGRSGVSPAERNQT